MDRYVAAFALVVSIGLVGCGQSNQPTETTNQPNQGNPNEKQVAYSVTNPGQANQNPPSAALPANPTQPASNLGATPEIAVTEFLEALRAGNEETAAGLLSPLARQKTSEIGLSVSPPGNPTAKYSVNKAELKPDDKGNMVGAHVLSRWTNTDEEGKPRTDDIYWVLRKEPEGWRIVGSVMTVYAGKEPLVLNYEDPADMQRKLQMVYETDAKLENQPPQTPTGQPQAMAPQGTPSATR